MADKFNYFKQLYKENKFDVLLKEKGAIYWLKLRAISRKTLMVEFCDLAKINCTDIKGPKLFEYIYSQQPSEKVLDKFIGKKYQEERAERKDGETKLISELYKLQVFDWAACIKTTSNAQLSIITSKR